MLRTIKSGVKTTIRRLSRSTVRYFGELWVSDFGKLRFGDFGRNRPISSDFGFDRGKPVDRYYIERALGDYAELVRGRVLEVCGRDYTSSFGAEKVVCSDVLDIDPLNPLATIVGDLGVVDALPQGAFDCIVLTQTLHLIYNLDNAMENLYRALAPGGALLITVPGISPIVRNWISIWYWAFTELSLKTLLISRFDESNVQVQSYGNVFAAISFLTGLSLEEVGTEKLDFKDESYPVTVFGCARKPR
jgi:SAM-dependent methyltransferase